MIGRANGVGPKLAARIANELQGKLGVAGLAGGGPAPRAGAAADALSALANLGFKPAEASAAVNAAQDELGPDAGLDALVRLALKKGGEMNRTVLFWLDEVARSSRALISSDRPVAFLESAAFHSLRHLSIPFRLDTYRRVH